MLRAKAAADGNAAFGPEYESEPGRLRMYAWRPTRPGTGASAGSGQEEVLELAGTLQCQLGDHGRQLSICGGHLAHKERLLESLEKGEWVADAHVDLRLRVELKLLGADGGLLRKDLSFQLLSDALQYIDIVVGARAWPGMHWPPKCDLALCT